jgi:beta-lactamase class A
VLPPDLAPVDWSIMVVDVGSVATLAAQDENRPLQTASVGKVFLLVEIARRAAAADLDLAERVRWRADELVTDMRRIGLAIRARVER